MSVSMTIPTRFARDRHERGLSNGLGHWTTKGFQTRMTLDELSNLKSDAAYYYRDVDNAPKGVVLSARATLERIATLRPEPTR